MDYHINIHTNNKMSNGILLVYYCPECGEGFRAEVWKTIDCPKCLVKIETDWFDDIYAGMIGTCKVSDENIKNK